MLARPLRPLPRRRFLGGLGALATLPWLRPLQTAGSPGEALVLERARKLSEGRRLRVLAPAGCEANVAPVARRFEAGSGVPVELVSVPVDDVATTMLVGDRTPAYDVALPPTFSVPDLAAAGLLLPLDELVEALPPECAVEPSLYALGDRYRGQLYGFQTDGDVYVMFYRQDWLEDEAEQAAYERRYGQPLALPATFEELDRQLEFFHRPEEGRFGGALFRNADYIGWEWWLRIHGKGRLPFAPDGTPQASSPEGVDALRELTAASAFLSPGAALNGLRENWEEFAEGNTYCNIGWGGTQKYLRGPSSAVRDRLVHGPTPGGTFAGEAIPISHFNWGWNYVVARGGENSELAFLFAYFAHLVEPSTIAVRGAEGFFDPFRDEHYTDPEIEAVYTRPFLDVHRESLSRALPDLYVPKRSEYTSVLNGFLSRAETGKLDPEVALAAVDREWERIRSRTGTEEHAEQWSRLLEQYPPELRRQLR